MVIMVSVCLVQLELLELHIPPEHKCGHILDTTLPACTKLHTLVLVGANPMYLPLLSDLPRLESLALNFCAGMDADHLTTLTSLRCSHCYAHLKSHPSWMLSCWSRLA